MRSVSYSPKGLLNHTAAHYQLMTGYTPDRVLPTGQLEPPSPRDFPNVGSNVARLKPANGAIAAVTEGDFAITAPTQLKAGNVLLRVHNNGPEEHELIVVRVGDPRLPFRADGFTVDEEAIQRSEPGSLVPGQPGSTRDLRINLKPGRYVLLCNMAGHYLGGMHSNLVVTQ